MLKLYKFDFDCGRMGRLFGLFVAEEKDIKNIIGKKAYFGEVLGKHSEIYGTIEENDIEIVTNDQEFIAKFENFNCAIGYNPLDYVRGEEK